MNRMAALCGAILIAFVLAAPTVANGTSETQAADVATAAPPVVPTGAQELAWSKAFEVPTPFAVESLVAAHDRFYALANDYDTDYYSPSAMWTSEDGTHWIELDVAGLLADGASLHSMAASERGLLVLGFRPAPQGYAATAWFSADGVLWDASDLGYVVEPATQPYTTSLLSFSGAALGPSGAIATATAFPGFDWTAAQVAALAALPADLAGIDPHRVGTTPDSVQVTVGPFVVFSESLESVGLGEVGEAQRMTNSPSAGSRERSMTFRTDDLDEWTVIDGNPMEATYVGAIVTVGGDYVAAASGQLGGSALYVSSDGQAWEPTNESMEGIGGLFVMGDRLLTDGWEGSQRVTLVSDDVGRTWEEVGMPDLSASWIAAAGPAGVLATGTDGEIGWGASPEPGVLERDGYIVTFDPAREEFTVADPTGALLVSSALRMHDPEWGWGYTAPDELVFDFDAETAAVQDPSTGATLLRLTFADLDQLFSMTSLRHEALLFSPDAEHWTVTTLDEAFGPEAMLVASVVGTDQVVAVVGSGYSDPYRNQSMWVGLPVAGSAAPTVEAREGPPEVVMGGRAPVWDRVLELGDVAFTTMLATSSGVWAIEEDRDQPGTLWHSTDGAAWTRLDAADLLGQGAVVSELAEGGPGLLAVGSAPDGHVREAVAWTSTDGQEWTRSALGYTLPEPEQPYDEPELSIRAVAAGPEGAVIAATPVVGFDFNLLEPAVEAALPNGLRDFASGSGVMIDPWRISVSVGPFEVFSESVSDLDVEPDLFDAYERTVHGGMREDVLLFVTDDYVTWQQVDGWPGQDDPVTAMTATADGYLAATWAWGSEAAVYASADGLAWEERELPAHAGMVRWFGTDGGRLLMAGELRGQAAVWASDDGGETWTPWAGLPADAWDVRAGTFGLVATGEHPSEWWNSSRWATTVIEHDGLTLSIAAGPGGCRVSGPDGETLLTADLSSAGTGPGLALPSFITADHARAVFRVVDPESGDTLMTVPYREMQDAYELARGTAGLGPDTFIGYSADGRVWSEQAISVLAGVPGWASSPAVSDDFAVIVISELEGPSSLWRAATR